MGITSPCNCQLGLVWDLVLYISVCRHLRLKSFVFPLVCSRMGKDYSVKSGTSAYVVEVTAKVFALVSEQPQLIISGILT